MLCGRLVALDELRHTPAGVPALRFRIGHSSTQLEAGVERRAECEISALALAETAQRLNGARRQDAVRVTGFLARNSRTGSQLVLHVNNVEFLEGNDHGTS